MYRIVAIQPFGCNTTINFIQHLLLFCPDWAAERQWYFVDSVDITDVFQDSDNLVEFLMFWDICPLSPPHIGIA